MWANFSAVHLYLLCLIGQRCCYLLYFTVSLTGLLGVFLAFLTPSIKCAKNKDSVKNEKGVFFFIWHLDSRSLWGLNFLYTHVRQKVTCFLMIADALLQIMRHLPFVLLIFTVALGFCCQNVFPCKSRRHGVEDHTVTMHFTSCNSASEEKSRQMTRQLAVTISISFPLHQLHPTNNEPLESISSQLCLHLPITLTLLFWGSPRQYYFKAKNQMQQTCLSKRDQKFLALLLKDVVFDAWLSPKHRHTWVMAGAELQLSWEAC